MTERRTFTLQEREAIRYALLEYKTQHQIGCPALAKRIEEAAPNRGKTPVYHKTLSRFLAKKHQPEDQFIARCKKFIETLPPPDRTTEENLAASLRTYLATGRYRNADIEGQFDVYEINNGQATAYSSLISLLQGDWCLVEEKIAGVHIFYDGVLVSTASGIVAIMKERLTGLMQHYTLVNWGLDGGSGLLLSIRNSEGSTQGMPIAVQWRLQGFHSSRQTSYQAA